MSDPAFPIKFVLYTHFFYGREEKDVAAYKTDGFKPETLTAVNELIAHFRGLSQLLNAPGHEGMMIIFYAAGYQRFLEALANTEDVDALLGSRPDPGSVELCFGREVAAYVDAKLRELDLDERVRFVTPRDLHVILGRVNRVSAENFKTFFLGRGKGIRYDAPKVVEAILRLRLIGTGVPVLRLDQDVIFRGDNKDIGDLAMFKAVACAVRAYQLRIDQPAISTFVFSGSYNSRALLRPNEKIDKFGAWSRAFATRVFPALIAKPKELTEICSEKDDEARAEKWNSYVVKVMDDPDAGTLIRQFYGLAPLSEGLKVITGEGITCIGAHPLQAVISGSLLCLSDGAIVDLPPFSNFSNNVMWIDDHLKYALHRAMNHFPTSEPLRQHRGLSDARLDDVTVTKARPAPGDLPNYVLGIYLPTLFFGTIVDAWITTEPLLKYRLGSLTPRERKRVLKAREKQHLAPLPYALSEALKAGTFENRDLGELKKALTIRAVKRIEEVRQQWLRLKTANRKTFACYWAEGKVAEAFGEKCFPEKSVLWRGITPHDHPVRKLDDLYPDLRKRVDDLIADTIDYVKWTLAWPKFMQIVRSVRQGEFRGDLSWRPPVRPAAAAATAPRGRSRRSAARA